MSDLIFEERPQLRDPVLVCAFKGWNDAGEAATAALSFVGSQFGATDIGRIEPDEYFDFTAVRPTVKLAEGHTREIEWPSNALTAAYVPGAEHDLVLLDGVEPSLRWHRFCSTVIEAAQALGARTVVTLGALLADVPHSRPVSVTGISSDGATIDRLGLERTSYEGPTGIVGVLHHACSTAGLDTVSLWASVPHYVAAAPNPKVALALVRAFEGSTHVTVDAAELEDQAADYERQVSAAVQSDPEVRDFVERLESAMDEVAEDSPAEEHIPSADTIARDFQKFLRQQGDR
jgi:proteasome assembly chaperone (PAC2) family protein